MVGVDREVLGRALVTWREWAKAKLRPKLSAASAEREKDWLVAGIAAEVFLFIACLIEGR